MSYFGKLMAAANVIVDGTFAESYTYTPMRESVNSVPEPDPTRPGGVAFVIMLKPGFKMLQGGIHPRATAETTLYYMARGILSDVQRFDRFELSSEAFTNLDTKTRYEVADGPIPYGFGRYKATMIELPLIDPSVRSSVMAGEIPWERR